MFPPVKPNSSDGQSNYLLFDATRLTVKQLICLMKFQATQPTSDLSALSLNIQTLPDVFNRLLGGSTVVLVIKIPLLLISLQIFMCSMQIAWRLKIFQKKSAEKRAQLGILHNDIPDILDSFFRCSSPSGIRFN